jgi:hypothetical protein
MVGAAALCQKAVLRERRAKLACGEVFQGAKASVEFSGLQSL